MFKISHKSEYGIHFLATLAANHQSRQPVSIATISKKLGLPLRFLSRIATQLKKASLVDSKEGTKGGYRLHQDPTTISIKKVIETLDGPIGIVDCQTPKGCHKTPHCEFKASFDTLKTEITTLLEKRTVTDFM